MPTYDYKCSTCKNKMSLTLRVSEYSKLGVQNCIICGGELTRQFSPVPAIYKCGGFYTTDYKQKGR